MDTPDYFGELTAWRKFNVRDRGRVLVSANHPIPWTTADPGEAVCIAETQWRHDAVAEGEDIVEHGDCPALKCSCGFYAYKEQTDALQHGQGVVLAQVKVWGRIAEHTRGYRAARMRISELYLPDAATGDVDALALRYGVAVFVGGDLWTSVKQSELSQLNQLQSQWNYLNGQYLAPALAAMQNYQNQQLSRHHTALAQQNAYPRFTVPSHYVPYVPPPTPRGRTFAFDPARNRIEASDGSTYDFFMQVSDCPPDLQTWAQRNKGMFKLDPKYGANTAPLPEPEPPVFDWYADPDPMLLPAFSRASWQRFKRAIGKE